MNTLLRTRNTVSRILIASIWLVVSLSDLAGARVVKGNIEVTLQKHEAIRRARRNDVPLNVVL